jgi:cell wall-associated NlpC family hydrolase
MIEPAEVIEHARTWVGVRFLHQGRSRNGADCLGFIAGMMAELGVTTPLEFLPKNYARNPQSLLRITLGSMTREIPLQPAAFVLIKFPFAKEAGHGAIYTGTSLIHSFAGVGRVVEHGYGQPWLKRTDSIWAVPLVMYE